MGHHSFLKSELLRCSEGVLFGADTPKLPAPPLLAFDEIVEIGLEGGKYNRGYAVGRKDLSSISWVFESHFHRDPVMPGTMMLEGLLQLAGFFGAFAGSKGKGRAARVDDIRFLSEVTPDDKEIVYQVDVLRCNSDRTLLLAEGVAKTGNRECASVSKLWVCTHKEEQAHQG